MTEKREDGRVRYTKMVIRSSLIALLREKPIAKVTVTEICRGANVNRATFYAHYADPVDLLHSIEAETTADITGKLGNAFSTADPDLKETLTRVFEYIRDNAETCAVLLSDGGDNSFQAQVVGMLEKRFISEWTAARAVSREDAEYLYTFAAIGSVGLIHKWLGEGMKKSPAEMADLVLKLSNKGYSAF